MKKKPQRTGLGSLLKKSEANEQNTSTGLKLSEVKEVTLAMLRVNPLNSTLFQEESSQYFDTLTSDIRERGILVPIIAKEDGTLLAGHNRLRVAQILGLRSVPVQYVEDDLSSEQEQHFVIKDNLLRRHLKPEQRIELYKRLYPNFDDRVLQDVRGGDRKSKTYKNQSGNIQFDIGDTSMPLSAPIVASHTGQNVETVRKDLQKHRTALIENSSVIPPRKKGEKLLVSKNEVLNQAKKHVKALENTLQKADKKTRLAILKEIEALLVR
ncbi:MAG: ParB N-terminal domain-containing protein [Ignavibacteria bacterium]|nr:ParB N-terminal domain-containing protein [Ignavibacteria bacterium]